MSLLSELLPLSTFGLSSTSLFLSYISLFDWRLDDEAEASEPVLTVFHAVDADQLLAVDEFNDGPGPDNVAGVERADALVVGVQE